MMGAEPAEEILQEAFAGRPENASYGASDRANESWLIALQLHKFINSIARLIDNSSSRFAGRAERPAQKRIESRLDGSVLIER